MLLPATIDRQEKIVRAVGTIGAVKLAVLGAYRPVLMHANEIKSEIKCAGETHQGYVPFQQLARDGVFSMEENFKSRKKVGSTPTLDDITLAFPFLPMMWILEHKTQGKYSLVDGIPNMQTNLPLELQYTQAAALPLYPKTRVAHLSVTMQVLRIRGSNPLNIAVYKSSMSLSHHHAKCVPDLVPKLKEIEEKLGEFNNDEKQAEAL
ncbi:unnamed protein product [Mucor fragilis]